MCKVESILRFVLQIPRINLVLLLLFGESIYYKSILLLYEAGPHEVAVARVT